MKVKYQLFGFFAAEGALSIGFAIFKKAQYGLMVNPKVSVRQKDKAILQQFQNFYGGKIRPHKTKHPRTGNLIMLYEWVPEKIAEMKTFLQDFDRETLLDSSKRIQAKLMLKALRIIEERKQYCISKEELIQLAEIAEEITTYATKGHRKWTAEKIREHLAKATARGHYWSNEELKILEAKVHPREHDQNLQELCLLLPLRTPLAIHRKAEREGLI